MKKFLMPLFCTILGFALSTQSSAQNSPKDEDQIRNVIAEMTAGFNKHDAKAACQMYTVDADFVTARGDRWKGASEIEKQLAALFAARLKDATLRTLNVTVRFIAPDVAVAHVTNELSGLVRPDGEKLPPHTELSIRVFVKAGAVWKVAAFHNTIVAPF
jgi:uncharacterized protein (TIGR02246 family)